MIRKENRWLVQVAWTMTRIAPPPAPGLLPQCTRVPELLARVLIKDEAPVGASHRELIRAIGLSCRRLLSGTAEVFTYR